MYSNGALTIQELFELSPELFELGYSCNTLAKVAQNSFGFGKLRELFMMPEPSSVGYSPDVLIEVLAQIG